MSKLTNRRAILKMMALLPVSMSLGPALRYFQKSNLPGSIETSNLPVSIESSVRSACAKLDAGAFSELWASVPFSINGQNGKTISGFAIKINQQDIVAYPSQCPKLGCSLDLVSDLNEIFAHFDLQSQEPVVGCRCHRNAFDLASGQILSGPQREPLQSYRVKQCHQKVCVIVEDA